MNFTQAARAVGASKRTVKVWRNGRTRSTGRNEETTMKWISDRLGKQTIDTRTTSQSKGQTGGFTINYQRTGRELMTPDELGVIPSDECVYLLRGVQPFLSRKISG